MTADELERAGAAGTASFNPFAKFFQQGDEPTESAAPETPAGDESKG